MASDDMRASHREWVRLFVERAPRDEVQAMARGLGEYLPTEPADDVRAAISSLRDALLEELGEGGQAA